jgi:hypothetical protein
MVWAAFQALTRKKKPLLQKDNFLWPTGSRKLYKKDSIYSDAFLDPPPPCKSKTPPRFTGA